MMMILIMMVIVMMVIMIMVMVNHDDDHGGDVDAKLGCSEEETAFSSFVMEEEDEDMFNPVRFNCNDIGY